MAQKRLAKIQQANAYSDCHEWQAVARFYDFGPDDIMTGWSDTILAPYAILEREKKGKPWRKTGSVMGSCQNDADQQAGIDVTFDPLKRAVNERDWISIQTAQHLKALKIKVR